MTTGFDGYLPIPQLPAYWAEAGGDFDHPPDLLIIHSASLGDNPARYLADPVDSRPSAVLCPDGKRRVEACAHLAATHRNGGFRQLASLLVPVWGSGGSVCQGRGRTNQRALHLELPAHAGPSLVETLFMLVWMVRVAVPSLRWWTCHRWIRDSKRDPVCFSDGEIRAVMLGSTLEETR